MSMTDDRRAAAFPAALQAALDWLAAPPTDDCATELAALRHHLDGLSALRLPPPQWLKIADLLQTRAALVASQAKPQLFDAALPLGKRLRQLAQGLIDIHGRLAATYESIVATADPARLRQTRRSPAYVCAQGIANLAQQFEITQLVCAPPPPGLWRRTRTLFDRLHDGLPADATLPIEADSADRTLKAMLALAAAQPEGFAAREVAFLAEYLRSQASTVDIHSVTGDNGYWLDLTGDQPPQAARRRAPPPGTDIWQFSCEALASAASGQLAQLAAGESPEALGLPSRAMSPDYRNALARAQASWASPRRRQANRRRGGPRIQVCPHLGPLWTQLRGLVPSASGAADMAASDWMVVNESPSGYAIMHVAGSLSGLVPGGALGLRAAPDRPWSICVVRWARSDNPEHVELGIEILAPHAEAVHIARGGTAAISPVPALLLPALPSLKRPESLLTARGQFTPGRFTLLGESAARIQVADCRASQLAIHTPCIEVFEFERQADPA